MAGGQRCEEEACTYQNTSRSTLKREFNERMSYKGVDGDKHPTKDGGVSTLGLATEEKSLPCLGPKGRGDNAYLNPEREREL